MHVIEIEDSLAVKIEDLAKSENKSISEFVSLTLREIIDRRRPVRTDDEKLRRFAESYEREPQRPEEWEIWQSEQVWEDE